MVAVIVRIICIDPAPTNYKFHAAQECLPVFTTKQHPDPEAVP